tara:strand:+ start:538 stop:2358 length:1821 start_codon:yes stop_codon:yes gene_type:complete
MIETSIKQTQIKQINLELKPVNDLLGKRFFIPSYQRGYRWKELQVQQLLDDIWEFRSNAENQTKVAFYCLQPIVVSKHINEETQELEWEVIDGQQRLTTLFIILDYLKEGLVFLVKEKYIIHYQTRKNSGAFLNNINVAQNEENIDYFHFCEVHTAVKKWFADKDGTAKINFLTTLLNDNETGKNVKVIWYDVSEENISNKYAIDIFTRLNIGKIPLTNAELIKALFLKKDNFNEHEASLEQIQIASEWDAIEKQLQNDDFWYFIYTPKKDVHYENRIEYIFDLMKQKPIDAELHYTFYEFQKDFTTVLSIDKKPDVRKIWLEIKRYFLTFEEWFNNRELFHLIGYLVTFDTSIRSLKNFSETKTKLQFKKKLHDLVKSVAIPKPKIEDEVFELENLSYGDSPIKKILLLFNIQTILTTNDTDIKFPFHRFKTENWDIEHIRSQTDKNIAPNERKEWMEDIYEYLTGETWQAETKNNSLHTTHQEIIGQLTMLLSSATVTEGEFFKLYDSVKTAFREKNEPVDKDSINNLALLDAKTNRSYGNAMFPIKRNTIIKNDMTGVFVPICTKNVFLKSYSTNLSEIMYWSDDDAKDYLKAMKSVLSKYLN